MAKNDSWLPVLLYYKGEEKCPFGLGDPLSTFWQLEQCWMSTVVDDDRLCAEYFANLIDDFPDFLMNIAPNTPTSLKAFFYDQYTHFGGSREGFKAWLLCYVESAATL